VATVGFAIAMGPKIRAMAWWKKLASATEHGHSFGKW